jgi:hypothetical protein
VGSGRRRKRAESKLGKDRTSRARCASPHGRWQGKCLKGQEAPHSSSTARREGIQREGSARGLAAHPPWQKHALLGASAFRRSEGLQGALAREPIPRAPGLRAGERTHRERTMGRRGRGGEERRGRARSWASPFPSKSRSPPFRQPLHPHTHTHITTTNRRQGRGRVREEGGRVRVCACGEPLALRTHRTHTAQVGCSPTQHSVFAAIVTTKNWHVPDVFWRLPEHPQHEL